MSFQQKMEDQFKQVVRNVVRSHDLVPMYKQVEIIFEIFQELPINMETKNKIENIHHSWNPYQEKRFSFADVMTKFMQFYSPFMNMSKINVTRELEPVLNQLQEEMRLFHKKIDDLFMKIPKEYREGD